MDLKFRSADHNDAALIAQLADSIWRKHYASIITVEQIDYMLKTMYDKDSLLAQMGDGQWFELVYDGAIPIGYISLSTKDGRHYFLHKFYVETAAQGKGVGAALFQHVMEKMDTGETIELTVNRKNYKAINFYFKKGFVIKDVADFDIGFGFFMNDFIMIKKLK